MLEYFIPSGEGASEYTEKRSRFIGHIWPAGSEEEARARIEETKSKYHDARHNCWCFSIRDGGLLRYSDDGEPQGTAGQPMLEVFSQNNIENICCVVTRYFGGVLLGPGGLARAYVNTAKLALGDAGISAVRMWKVIKVSCGYGLFERIKSAMASLGGQTGGTDYGADVVLTALLPEDAAAEFADKVRDISLGGARCDIIGEKFMAAPFNEKP